MAFFQNTMPNAVVGISLPTDGSDTITLHLAKQGVDGGDKPSYDTDKQWFEQFPGARVFLTSGGCMVTVEGAQAVNAVLDAAASFFEAPMLVAVKERRKMAWEDALRIRLDKDAMAEQSQRILKRFQDARPANTSNRFGGSSVVNIRTYLTTLS